MGTILNLEDLHHILRTNAHNGTQEYTRLFHGRGNAYEKYTFLTIDSVDKVLFAVLFEANDEEEAIVSMLRDLYTTEGKWETLIIQQRYIKDAPSTIIEGQCLCKHLPSKIPSCIILTFSIHKISDFSPT